MLEIVFVVGALNGNKFSQNQTKLKLNMCDVCRIILVEVLTPCHSLEHVVPYVYLHNQKFDFLQLYILLVQNTHLLNYE